MTKDIAAERGVLAGICEHGSDLYLDICDMVKTNTFSTNSNQCIWKCLEHICKQDDNAKVDFPSILSAAKELGLSSVIERTDEVKHLNSIINLHIEPANVRRFAKKIRKLEIARLIHNQGSVLQEKMLEVQGTEPITQILGIAEEVIFDFTSLIDDGDNHPQKLGSDLDSYLDYLAANPVQKIGISTGFDYWDEAIGGGLRKATLNVIAARAKVGKTIITDNMGYHIAKNENIPVLNLDTEMLKEDHQHRALAMLSGIGIRNIETGQFGQNPNFNKSVREAATKLGEVPYYHRSIAGLEFEEQLGIMRRWIQREVGLTNEGYAKPCVIIYDYLKLMDTKGISATLQEFQLLGFMMTTLHNFAVRYKVPFVILMQLNRDGIAGEGTDTASGSDRIVWLCSNYSIFKPKSAEEIEEDGPCNGNRKIVVVVSRHGEGTKFGDYINYNFEGWKAKISELGMKCNADQNVGEFNIDEQDEDDDIPF